MHPVLNPALRGLTHVCLVTAVVAYVHQQFSGLLHGAHAPLAGCRAAWCNPCPPEKKTLSKAATLVSPQLHLFPNLGLGWLSVSSCKSSALFLSIFIRPFLHQRDWCSSRFIDCLSAIPDSFWISLASCHGSHLSLHWKFGGVGAIRIDRWRLTVMDVGCHWEVWAAGYLVPEI